MRRQIGFKATGKIGQKRRRGEEKLILNRIQHYSTILVGYKTVEAKKKYFIGERPLMEFFNQRTFCLITGASRGIGKCIGVEFGKKVGAGSVFLLVARSAQALQDTKSEMDAIFADIKIVTATVDLEKVETADYFNLINTALNTTGTSAGDFEHAILVHNAASPGDLSLRAIERDNLETLRNYYDLNVFSLILLTSQFFKIFIDAEKQRSIIQITSPAALQPFKSFHLSCMGKAARDMFVKCVAAEDPSISCVSYDPGPVDTEMFDYVKRVIPDKELMQLMEGIKASGNLLTPTQTVTKLIAVLESKKFTKGEHVAYYDEL